MAEASHQGLVPSSTVEPCSSYIEVGLIIGLYCGESASSTTSLNPIPIGFIESTSFLFLFFSFLLLLKFWKYKCNDVIFSGFNYLIYILKLLKTIVIERKLRKQMERIGFTKGAK
jgi:hypothetical protein